MASPRRERQRLRKVAGTPVRIVVCTYPAADIRPAVDLLKSAVLYGDQVVLHSPMGSILGQFSLLAQGDAAALTEMLLGIGESHPKVSALMRQLDDDRGPGHGKALLAELANPQSATRKALRRAGAEENVDLDGLDQSFADMRRQLDETTQEQLRQFGFDAVSAAFDAGVLYVAPVDPTEDLADSFTRKLDEILSDPTVYPLFDAELGKFVKSLVEGGKIDRPAYNSARGAQAATADRLLAQLPTFPFATMDEIVDIRNDLRGPLIKFRSEMITVTGDLSLDPLSVDFEAAAIELWHQRVAPCIEELDEIARQGGIFRNYGPQAASDLLPPAAAFIAGVSAGSLQSGAAAASAAAVAGVAGHVRKTRADNARRKAANPYFFLHETNRKLTR